MNTPKEETTDAPAIPTLPELALAFAKMSLMGFGGVLVWARRAIVEHYKWMTAEQFNETFALCHFLPGPNIVNLSVVSGARFRGAPGAAAAFIGLVLPPVIIVMTLAFLYSKYGEMPALQRTLGGVVCATVGMFFATVIKMTQPLVQRRALLPLASIVIVFVVIGVLRWPLQPVLLVAIPLSLVLTYYMSRRRA